METALEMIDRLMATGRLTRGQEIYLETLVQLVQVYEAAHHAIETSDLRGIESLEHLLAEERDERLRPGQATGDAPQHGLEAPEGGSFADGQSPSEAREPFQGRPRAVHRLTIDRIVAQEGAQSEPA